MRLIYVSPVPWDSFSQRPHELIRYFYSRTGGKVLWIDPYPTRFPVLADLLNKRPHTAGTNTQDTTDWLTVIKPNALPIEPLPFSGAVNRLIWRDAISKIEQFVDSSTIFGIGKPSEIALQLLATMPFTSSFYDAMDDFPAFYAGISSLAMSRREHKIIRQVRTVLVSSSALQIRLKPLGNDVRLVLNACASDRMPTVFNRRITGVNPNPIFGYVGTIARWFDWNLVLSLAMAYPQAKLRLIGPIYAPPPPTLPSNIFLEAPLPHSEALQAMTQFDIGIIPFKRTTLTSSVDPIKYYEYRALGLPVVSSAFGEMALRSEHEGVWLIDQNSNVKEVVESALESTMDMISISEFRRNNSWERRFEQSYLFTA